MREMRKFIAGLVLMMLLFSAVSAASGARNDLDKGGNGNSAVDTQAKGASLNQSTGVSAVSQGKSSSNTSQGLLGVDKLKIQVKNNSANASVLKEKIRIQLENFSGNYSNLSVGEQTRLKNENQVRLAVQALIMTDGVDGIGQQVSEIAREFNNSVKTAYAAEEKINNRNAVINMLFGGDNSSASEILGNVEENQNRIESLNQYINQSDCDEELRLLLLEQVRILEEEQTRLSVVAEKEQSNKGLLGGIFS